MLTGDILHLHAEWRDHAKCLGDDNPDRFFEADPPDEWFTRAGTVRKDRVDELAVFRAEEGARLAHVARFCEDCPVRPHCAAFALATGERFGVWGGRTPLELDDLGERLAS